MLKERYLTRYVHEDVMEKMVFVGGPRQVGKTTLAKHVAGLYFKNFQYLNWDEQQDRRDMKAGRLPTDKKLIIFDEIHKYKNWKNFLKGIYDKHKDRYKILVTGSARLDVYRKGGDSLLGRYHYYRLHPFTIAEFINKFNVPKVLKEIDFYSSKETKEALDILLKFGGFPEPLLKQNEKALRRWHNERTELLVREDIRDLQNIRDISSLETLVDILPSKVGSLLSLNSLREDVEVAHKTIALWMNVLERFYYHFRIFPFYHNKIRALKKESKLYLWDWSQVNSEAALFENIVASHLLKFCHFLKDNLGYRAELWYLRDVDGREVDFFVSIKDQPWFAVEVKSSFQKPAHNLLYFGRKIKIPFLYQTTFEENVDVMENSVRIISVDKFLSGLI
ncbi:MAG: ATP-binding protein [Candidatus Omnitrophica bacterium]|nr:ATP-binding protein [Candidatus Omnitrophota bacterium]